MDEQITPEVFDHLVSLAALELSPEESEYLRRQLNNQLKAIREMVSIPLDPDLPLASHGVAYPPQVSPEPRADEWIPYPNPDLILAQTPETNERLIVVPDIPHTDLQ